MEECKPLPRAAKLPVIEAPEKSTRGFTPVSVTLPPPSTATAPPASLV